MSVPVSRKEAKRQGAIFLLDLSWSGGELFVSTEPIDVPTGKTTVKPYVSGLSPITLSMSESIDEIDFTINTNDDRWLDAFRRNYNMQTMTARLRRYYRGMRDQRAPIIVEGTVEQIQTLDPAKPGVLSGTIRNTNVTSSSFPNDVIDAESLSSVVLGGAITSDCPSLGSVRPVVFGCPGATSNIVYAQIPATPAYELTLKQDPTATTVAPSWLVAGHHCFGVPPTHATDGLRLRNVSSNGQQSTILGTISGVQVTLRNVTDLNSNDAAIIQFNTIGSAGFGTLDAVALGGEFWVGFESDRAIGGLRSPYRFALCDGVSDVLRFVYENHTTRDLDSGAFESYQSALNSLKVDTVVNQQVDAESWIKSLTAIYPVRIINGARGTYARLRATTPSRDSVVARLGPVGHPGVFNVHRETALESHNPEIYNRIILHYAPRELGGDFMRQITVTSADEYRHPSLGTLGSPVDMVIVNRNAELSQTRHGVRTKTIEAPTVFDESTACAVASYHAELNCWPRYRATYSGDQGLESLKIGDVVNLLDPDICHEAKTALTPRLATVEDILIEGSKTSVVLELVPDQLTYSVPRS